MTTAGLIITQWSLPYISRSQYLDLLNRRLPGLAKTWWQMRSKDCGDPRLDQVGIWNNYPEGSHIEHIIPLSTASRFASVANWGRNWRREPYQGAGNSLPRGSPTRTRGIRSDFWVNVWNNPQGLPSGLPPVTPGSTDLRRPVDRVFEALGSNTNPSHLVLLQGAIDRVKGRYEGFRPPIENVDFERYVRQGANGNDTAIQSFLAPLRETIAMFEYLRDPAIASRRHTIASSVTQQLQLIERHTRGSEGLTAHWHEFYPFYFNQVSIFARSYVTGRVQYIQRYFSRAGSYKRESVLAEVKEIADKIPELKYPWDESF
ncbi:hypothetical protein F5X98DRAFT_356233 [Xylaria grammica]|nr:hypothetical protein F5X98DRAFT_356233 [Xylaria grammica]